MVDVNGIVQARENARHALRDYLTPGAVALYGGYPVRVISANGDLLDLEVLQACQVDELDGHPPQAYQPLDRFRYCMPPAGSGQDGGLISIPAVRHLYGTHSDIPASGPGGQEYLWVQHADRDGQTAGHGGRAYPIRRDDQGAYILCDCDGLTPFLVPLGAIEYDPNVGPGNG